MTIWHCEKMQPYNNNNQTCVFIHFLNITYKFYLRKMILNREVLIFICLTPEEENHENYRKKEMQRNSRGH